VSKQTRNMGTQGALKKREKFLALLRQVGLVTEAARLAMISRNTPYEWARKSESFAEHFAEARAEGQEVLADRLEQQLVSRATDGVSEPVFYKGQQIGEVKRYSDVAGIVMLKSLRPGRFVEQLMAVNVAGGHVQIKIASFASLPAPVSPVAAAPAADPVEAAP
jgi:hypothetical protein